VVVPLYGALSGGRSGSSNRALVLSPGGGGDGEVWAYSSFGLCLAFDFHGGEAVRLRRDLFGVLISHGRKWMGWSVRQLGLGLSGLKASNQQPELNPRESSAHREPPRHLPVVPGAVPDEPCQAPRLPWSTIAVRVCAPLDLRLHERERAMRARIGSKTDLNSLYLDPKNRQFGHSRASEERRTVLSRRPTHARPLQEF
jgi:hypothetical protein